jgi:hypothetical protein
MKYAINCLDIELHDELEEFGIECLDLTLKSNDAEYMVEYLSKWEDGILDIFDFTYGSNEALFIFGDNCYSKSLSLALFFFYKR